MYPLVIFTLAYRISIQLNNKYYFLFFFFLIGRLGLMTHFGALAAATTCRSPLLAVYHSIPVSSAIDKQWYDAWAHLQQPVPAASPTGWYYIVTNVYFCDTYINVHI